VYKYKVYNNIVYIIFILHNSHCR